MSDVLVVSPRLSVPLAEIQLSFTRSSGPGGQHVNTSDTRVIASLDVLRSPSIPTFLHERIEANIGRRLRAGVLTVDSQRFRSQDRNRQDALDKLTAVLREGIAPPLPERRATKPTKASQRRRVDAKKRRGDIKRGRRSLGDE